MFRGGQQTRVDEKGRLKIPASFKREIDERFDARFYITSLDGRIAKLYPLQVWEEIEAKLEKKPDLDPAKELFLERTNYYGQEVEMDAQGRVLLPALLRDSAELKAEVMVVGTQRYLEVQNKEAYSKRAERPFTPEDKALLATLGI
jgi:MraZ protein